MSGWGSIISAAIPAVASVGSAFMGANAANNAAAAQRRAADQAAGVTQGQLALQQSIFDQNRADLAPWRAAGANALQGLSAACGPNFRASPGYAFRRDEALRAVNAGMAARGQYNSTARDRAAARYVDGLASQEFGDWWNRGAGLAGVGQTATAQGVQAAQNFGGNSAQIANNLAGIYGQAGNAAAAGAIGQANAWGGAFNNIANQDWRAAGKTIGSWFG